MSPRPGEIREIIEITLPRPRTEEMESTVEFVRVADRLRHLLRA
jgi:NitT/TauT family transport system ATP-binding protein